MTRDGRPGLVVYFETGMSNVTTDFPAVAAAVKAYVAEHRGAKLSVSGFNDPTGNAARNAALSLRRVQHVADALEGLGIPQPSITLEKPADTAAGGDTNAELRRVEVIVRE